ncbi:hypothetical protein Sjap_000186 [Stephania japonica]|uniref:Uncharacterized protein n=1 Tax=Stephania japonica TaxID=461633 RepID=A0AAP0KHK7_9MAGN
MSRWIVQTPTGRCPKHAIPGNRVGLVPCITGDDIFTFLAEETGLGEVCQIESLSKLGIYDDAIVIHQRQDLRFRASVQSIFWVKDLSQFEFSSTKTIAIGSIAWVTCMSHNVRAENVYIKSCHPSILHGAYMVELK